MQSKDFDDAYKLKEPFAESSRSEYFRRRIKDNTNKALGKRATSIMKSHKTSFSIGAQMQLKV